MRDSLLVFRNPGRLMAVLPAVLVGSGVELAPGSVQWMDDGIKAEAVPTPLSWWGDHLQVRLHPDEGGTTVVEFVSHYNGIAGFTDLDNVLKMRSSFKRTMKTLGVNVAWGSPRIN
ncbi:MAG: hypothetical protein ACHQ2Y_04930 [Candidatus Lutacidiplasmatales archaeon]